MPEYLAPERGEPTNKSPRIYRGLFGAFLKQYDIGAWLGALKDLFGRTVFYISIINFALISITTWDLTVKGYVHTVFPWFTYPMFVVTLLFIVATAFIIEYKLILPSSIKWGNLQSYTHRSYYRRDIEAVLEQLKEIKERLDKMEKK